MIVVVLVIVTVLVFVRVKVIVLALVVVIYGSKQYSESRYNGRLFTRPPSYRTSRALRDLVSSKGSQSSQWRDPFCPGFFPAVRSISYMQGEAAASIHCRDIQDTRYRRQRKRRSRRRGRRKRKKKKAEEEDNVNMNVHVVLVVAGGGGGVVAVA